MDPPSVQRRPSPSGVVRVPGATLGYRIEGSGLPTLVLGSSVYYPRTFAADLRAKLRMAFVDQRHFAQNADAAAGDPLETYLTDIEALRAAIGFERMALIGHSHHGNLALEYAKRYPQRVTHLVLIGATPVGVADTLAAGVAYWAAHASADRRAALQRNWARLTPAALGRMSAAAGFVAGYVADGPKYWYDPAYDASGLWQDVPIATQALPGFRALFVDYVMRWNPGELRAPVLVVAGRHDYVVPPTLWDAARPTLPPHTYHLFERSGHTPQLEESACFDRLLGTWLRTGSG
ncbi:alpha/beta hydrolase [Ectothiorhodospiraceae bacterium 2226]|nr:alpha/beta hydrolase [Ectothiorhodospiraceae bacterium 2226]